MWSWSIGGRKEGRNTEVPPVILFHLEEPAIAQRITVRNATIGLCYPSFDGPFQ